MPCDFGVAVKIKRIMFLRMDVALLQSRCLANVSRDTYSDIYTLYVGHVSIERLFLLSFNGFDEDILHSS